MDFRQRLEQSRNRPVSNDVPAGPDTDISSPYFATDRTGIPTCLDLRFSDGSRKAIPYAYLIEIGYNADKGVEIRTTTKCISIQGRNLSILYDHLLAYRVRYIQANIGNAGDEDEVFVKTILIENAL